MKFIKTFSIPSFSLATLNFKSIIDDITFSELVKLRLLDDAVYSYQLYMYRNGDFIEDIDIT